MELNEVKDELQKFEMALDDVVNILVEAYRQIAAAAKNACDFLVELFKKIREKQGKQNTHSCPRKYGMSLIRRTTWFPKYDYIPISRRNLPYQRRKYLKTRPYRL